MKKFTSLIFAGVILSVSSVYGSMADLLEAQLAQAEKDSENAFRAIAQVIGLPEDILALKDKMDEVGNAIAREEGSMDELALCLQDLGKEFQIRTQKFMSNRPEGAPNPTLEMNGVYDEALERYQILLLLAQSVMGAVQRND